MTLKTVRGNSIQAAMTEARRQFGDDIVLMQANPPDGHLQAEIIISLDDESEPEVRSRSASGTRTQTVGDLRNRIPFAATLDRAAGATSTRASTTDDLISLAAESLGYEPGVDSYSRTPVARPGREHSASAGGSSMPHRAATALRYSNTSPSEGAHVDAAENPGNDVPDHVGHRADAPFGAVAARMPRRAAQLLARLAAIAATLKRYIRSRTAGAPSSATEAEAQRPVRFLEAIDRRIGAIESALGSSIIGYDARWRLHPAYGEMIESGLSAETAGALLATLAARGIRSGSDDLAVRRDLSDELRRRMKVVIARRTRGRHLFVGPSGCGKTAMIAGLARDERLGRVLVVVAQPAGLGASLFDPAMVYDRLGVDSVSIHSSRQLELELETLDRYDTVLIDTPPIEMDDTPARAESLSAMMSSMSKLTVHLVVDARHDLKAVEEMLNRSTTNIDALALTHLDGLDRPGRLAEFFTNCRRPVYFSSNAPGARAGKHIFSPSRLASDTLNIGQWYSDGELMEYFNKERQPRARYSTLTPESAHGRQRLELNGRI